MSRKLWIVLFGPFFPPILKGEWLELVSKPCSELYVMNSKILEENSLMLKISGIEETKKLYEVEIQEVVTESSFRSWCC